MANRQAMIKTTSTSRQKKKDWQINQIQILKEEKSQNIYTGTKDKNGQEKKREKGQQNKEP